MGSPLPSEISAAEALPPAPAPEPCTLEMKLEFSLGTAEGSSCCARSPLLRDASVARASIWPPGRGPLCSTWALTSSKNFLCSLQGRRSSNQHPSCNMYGSAQVVRDSDTLCQWTLLGCGPFTPLYSTVRIESTCPAEIILANRCRLYGRSALASHMHMCALDFLAHTRSRNLFGTCRHGGVSITAMLWGTQEACLEDSAYASSDVGSSSLTTTILSSTPGCSRALPSSSTWCPLGSGMEPGSCWARRSTAAGRLSSVRASSGSPDWLGAGAEELGAGEAGRDGGAA